MDLIRVNYQDSNAIKYLSHSLENLLNKDTIIICIGTDRCILDSLGPLVGSFLQSGNCKYPVYGTLQEPIHSLNLKESIKKIKKKHTAANIIAIDAALGYKKNIGNVNVKKGSISPGKGVGKNLPPVGDYSILGIVALIDKDIDSIYNSSNIRLSFVFELAKIISSSILLKSQDPNSSIK